MKYRLIIRQEAEGDLSEAFEWYECQRKGLRYDFLLQVEAGFRFIEKNSLIHPEIYRRVRRHLIKRFPYKIFYRINEFKLIMLAVIYSGRDPEWVKKRIKAFEQS